MIIKKITLHPFAGFVDRTFEFENGLNVVLGANEAGKSTLSKALLMVLFDSTTQTNISRAKLLKEFLPIGGGDFVAVKLEFEYNNEYYILNKQWGSTNQSSLNKVNEAPITNPDDIQNKLNEILSQNRHVWESVMFASQAQLSTTHLKINGTHQVTTSLDSILQNAIINNAGIAPDELELEIEKQLKPIINNWDIENNLPVIGDKRKGSYDNRHAKNVGEILSLDYQIYDLKIGLSQKKEYDKQVDQIVLKLESLQEDYNIEIKSFLDQYKYQIEDFKKRVKLQNDKELLERDNKILREDKESWSKADSQTELIKDGYEKSIASKTKIIDELTIAQKKQAGATQQEKIRQVQPLMKQLDGFKKTQSENIQIDVNDYNLIKSLNESLGRGYTKYDVLKQVQSFNVEVTAVKNITVDIQKGNSASATINLNPETPHVFNAEGGFELKSNELIIKVLSNDDEFQKCENGIKELKQRISIILEKYQLKTVEDLIATHESHLLNDNEIIRLQGQIKNILGNDDYEGLQNNVNALNLLAESRSVQALTTIHQEASEDELNAKLKYEQNGKQIEAFTIKYETLNKLKVLELESDKKIIKLESEINQLSPLPEGEVSAQDIIDKYDSKLGMEKDYLLEISDLRERKAQMENYNDEKSVDDYESLLERLEEEKQQKIKEVRALKIVLQKLNDIINRAPVNPYEEYYNTMQKYLNLLSNQKYTSLNIEDATPAAIKQNNSKEIPVELLSQGTAGMLGLALRLSMANYFLDKRKGFLLLDDPMTDLDETRQQSTVNCLTDYADSKQVIIFTCHQSHAQQFGGNKINIS